MTIAEQEHETHQRDTVAELVREVHASRAAHSAAYLKRRHIVRLVAGWACFGVFLWGYLTALFSG